MQEHSTLLHGVGSMGLELQDVTRFATRVDETTGQKYTVKVKDNPYVRLNSGNGPPVFVQGGIAYAEGGMQYEFDNLPGWFRDLANLVGEVVSKQCGLDRLLQEIDEASGDEVADPSPEPKPERVKAPRDEPVPKNAKGQFARRKKAKKKRIKNEAEKIVETALKAKKKKARAEAKAKAKAEKE